ncbi:hypothetical protein HPP92_016380 [Vanilla planifolia]|uniref:Uncharacterized protein n=1 Tax=Vanilla planifolia TaxID=51239 RepID=A0A835QFJ2_VANPL|nr:hypothetical protein HPP92_016380 [Vanilla planifolia]
MGRIWGRFYWGRKEEGEKKAAGIVVLFAWLLSQEQHLRPYVDLYWSLGWGTIVCHVNFLTLFFPEKSTKLACDVLSELIKELKIRPLPIVLASFSGGSKGCLYKVLQVIDGKCKGQHSQVDYQLVRDCLFGQIYDSSPVDFTSRTGIQFVLHPSVLKLSHPSRVVVWMAEALASGLDAMFINRFEAERAEYWQTLFSSVNMGPFLILCSKDDELAPYKILCSFAKRLEELGGDIKLIKWSGSAHVAHYRHHRAEYAAAVSEFLEKASCNFSSRWPAHGSSHHRTPCSNGSIMSPADGFFLPTSTECKETKCVSLANDYMGDLFGLSSIKPIRSPSWAHFDLCSPKNVDGWDMKPTSSLNKTSVFSSTGRHGPFSSVKCIKRSRL